MASITTNSQHACNTDILHKFANCAWFTFLEALPERGTEEGDQIIREVTSLGVEFHAGTVLGERKGLARCPHFRGSDVYSVEQDTIGKCPY